LQSGTSHNLGQNFAKAQEIKYLSAEGSLEYAWTTSWGVSTRLVGALIMSHSDDDGLVVPPRLAPAHVVIQPIYRKGEDETPVREYCQALAKALRGVHYAGSKLRVKLDDRDIRGGEKSWQHIKKGVPIRLEVGPRDVGSDSVFMGRRDKGPREKVSMQREEFIQDVPAILEEMQNGLYERALQRRDDASIEVSSAEELEARFADGAPGGFVTCFAADDPSYADRLARLKVSARCIPVASTETGTCVFTGKPGARKTVFARAY